MRIIEQIYPLLAIVLYVFIVILFCKKKKLLGVLACGGAILCSLPPLKYGFSSCSTDKNNVFKIDTQDKLLVLQQNCWDKNNNFQPLISILSQHTPDIIFLQECNLIFVTALHTWATKNSYNLYKIKEHNPTEDLKRFSVTMTRNMLVSSIKTIPLYNALSLQIVKNGRKVTLINVHLDRPYRVSSAYYENFIQLINKQIEGDIIIGGDFNLVPWSQDFLRLCKGLNLKDSGKGFGFKGTYCVGIPHFPNFPFSFPLLPIDHILISPKFNILSCERFSPIGSDHLGVITNIFFLPP